MKKNLTMQLLPLWLLAFFFFASVPIKAQTYSEATPRVGIVKMIGCGTGTEANKAQIQVIHDGTGYSYNFGANASAQSGSTAWLPAGTHTVTVTKGSRTYKLPITVPAKVAPTFTPTITYNCNGTADVRLTNNQGTYNYTYTYGGNTHNSPYFRDLAVGQHTITVKYTQPTAGRDIVFFDDFGTKETGDPKAVRSKYAISTMNFAPLNGTQVQPNGTVVTGVNLTNDACYTVATKADADTEGSPSVWLYPNDKDGKANGRYLYYDAHTVNQNLYTRKAKVKPNTPVNFSAYLFNTVKSSYNSAYTVRVTLDIYANEAAAQAGTAPLFRSYYFNVPTATTDADKWYPINVTANIGGSYSELVFVVRMYGDSLNGGIGNDIALDNVLVTQPTAICEQTVDVPVNVVTNTNTYSTTVTYNCAANNATIKVTPSVTTGYTYTYKLDNGTAGSNNTFNNVAVGVHTLTLTSQYTGAKVIFKEDFGSGAPYRLPETVVPKPFVCKDVLYGYPADILAEGHYQVANVNNLTQMNTWNWRSPKDHTNSADGQGRYLAFNYGANANKTFYKQDIRVEANKPVTVEYYAYNINQNSTVALPAIKVTLVNKATNSTVHTSSTYSVIGNTSDTDWKKVTFTFTPPVNARDLELNFINEENSEGSNDFAIDDILVTQAYEVCTTTLTATVAPKVTQAFAGVTRLIGCGTGANANKALVEVTNIEGGNGNYEFRFGNSGSWVATNTGWLEAGTHTVSVRNTGSEGCVYNMSVTVPDAIAAPTIKTEVFYSCEGKPILKVGVQSPVDELTYLYKLDNGAFTTTYVFTDISTGTHSVSVQFNRRQIASPYILMKEDFGKGAPMALPGIVPSTWQHQPANGGTQALDCLHEGKYTVAPQSKVITCAGWCWTIPKDHTSNGTDATGRYYAMNVGGATPGQVFYYKDVDNIKPNRPVKYEMYLANLLNTSCAPHPTSIDANIQIKIIDKNTSTVLDTQSTGHLPRATNDFAWRKYEGTLNPGNATSIRIQFIDLEAGYGGNDFAIDDITVYQDPDICGQEVTTTATVTPLAKPSFSANVSNCSNTNSTITWVASPTTGYTYTYTLQGGTATSSNVFNGLAIGNHTFTIDYKVASETTITILKEDFGAGTEAVKGYYTAKNLYFNTNKSGAYTAYNANGQGLAHNNAGGLQEYEYTIAHQLIDNNGNWNVPNDHSGKASGRIFFVNPTTMSVQDVYLREVSVLPNRALTLSAAFFNLVKYTGGEPQVQLAIYDKAGGILLGQTSLFVVPKSDNGNSWHIQSLPLTAVQLGNRTSVYIVVRMLNTVPGNHDLAVDDIVLTQAPLICSRTVTATVQNQVQKAFAGVTKLIGCGTGANANKAEVTIANVEGGSGTYEYQFDGLTWTNTNTGWLSAGTHTVSVRDSVTKSCAYDMSVTVPAALAQPTIKTAVHYACDGKAILNIGVENPDPALKYLYSLDGAAYTSTYVYTGVASGTHSVSVQYEHRSTPSPYILMKEDFGKGAPMALPGIVPSTWQHQPATTGVLANDCLHEGKYTVAPQSKVITCAGWCWTIPKDHTSNGTDATGRYYAMNVGGALAGQRFYYKDVDNVQPNRPLKYEMYLMNLLNTTCPPHPTSIDANIEIRIIDKATSAVLDTKTTGRLPRATHDLDWRKYEGTLNPGSATSIRIEFRDLEAGYSGNDFAIDDIIVYQEPVACGQVVSTTKVVTANNQDIPAFTVSKTYNCATGKGALTVTPTATTGFTYTYTLGSTTYTGTTATFTGLTLEQTYTVSVSYQAVSNTITLLNEDFGAGTTPIRSPYVGKNLYFNENTSAAYTSYNANGQSRAHAAGTFLKEEEYCIADHIAIRSYDWDNPSDHTGKTNGRMLYINGISAVPTQEVYTRQVNILPNLPLTFTTSFYNLIRNVLVVSPKTPRVNIALYENEATYRANANNFIAQTPILEIPSTNNKWETQTITLTAAQVANRTSMYAVVRMHNVLSAGHDLAVDDIVITQKLPACTTSVTATLTKGDVATPTLTLPANLTVVCSAPTASATISSWIASATATSTCGTATVTHNYSYPPNLCNVGGAVTVTFRTTDPFGNVVTATRVISFATMTLTVTPTTLSVPNGALGGTTSSVVPNITLGNTVSPSTNSVTITFSGLPTGVTSTTGGRLIVAPNTPAGTHTITYRVCETANNNNCKTVNTQLVIGTGSLTVTPVTPLTVPNGISGGTTSSVLTGITLNGATVTNTNSVTISFSGLPTGVTSNTNGQLVIPAGTPAGTHTITYRVCEKLNPTNCQTVTSTLVIGTGSLTVTPTNLTHPNGTQGGTTTGTVLTGVKINGNPVNTASVTITWNTLPPNATGNASGTVTIAPNTPAGTYTISYTVCESLNGNSNCQSVTSQITVGGGSLTATPTNLTHPNGTQGGTTTGTVLTGVKINGNPVNTASVTITWNSLPPNATGNASGTVTIAPNTPAGTYTISYTVCESLNGNSNCQSVTSQITIGGGHMTVTPTQLIVANGATGGTSVNNVLTGVTINGNPVNTNSVTITWNSLPPGFTGTNSGTVTIPANTPAGTYTVSYTVCERLNQNNNCKTVTSTITVGNGNMIVVPTPITVPNGTIGGTSTPSVLTGVVLNGNSNPAPNTVSITWNSLPPRATGNNDGTVNVAPNTPAGTYTVSYTICEALNNGHCTTVTSTITIGGGVLTVTPVTTLTVANGAQGGTTTSSVLTGVSLNGQPANSQSVTITFSGLPAGVTSNTNGQLVVAPGTPATNTTIYYTVCETLNANNNCHTYSTTLVIGTPNLSVTPRTYAIPDATVGGTTSSVLETVTIDGHTPSSQSVTITFGNLPVGIQTTTSGGFRVPAGTPTGIHTVTYTVCEVLNPDHCVTSIATIAVGNVPVVTPNAFTYTGTATVTTPSILDDDTVGTQSATTGTGGNVVINITSTPTGTVVPSLDANNGRVTIPAGTPPGIYTITYDVCTTATPTACTPGAVVITIPNVPVITPDDMVYTDTTTTTAGNILTNDRVGTQSATAGNGGNVSITVTIPATPKAPGATVPTLNPNTGVVTVPAGTPSGTYTITYKICTTATPTSCDTGVVTITVSGTVTEAPDTNDVTAYTRINTPVTVGVTSSTTVTVSIPSQPANGTAVSNGDGTITYTPNNGFKGTDSFEYSLCNAAGCRTATISVRVTSELIIYNGVSIGGSDKNNHFHIEGIENYPNNTVRIYNRWGVKVFEMSGYNNTTKAFKGVSDARATLEASDNLPQGTYYYIIEYVDEHNKTQTETGWLYLKKN